MLETIHDAHKCKLCSISQSYMCKKKLYILDVNCRKTTHYTPIFLMNDIVLLKTIFRKLLCSFVLHIHLIFF